MILNVHASYPKARTCVLQSLLVLALLLLSTVCSAQAQHVRVAIVADGPIDRSIFSVEAIEREVANVVANDLQIVFPVNKRYAGDWSLNGVNAQLDRALVDPEVDVVLTLGLLASHQAAHRNRLPKAVIAPLVADPMLQGYPLVEGRSGRRNFTYIADFKGLEENLRTFHQVVGFKHLAAIVDESLMRALPELAVKADQMATALGVRVSLVRTTNDVPAALAALPADADAVYVAGLLRFSQADMRTFANGLITKRLPSFTVIGRSELEAGLLMTTGGAQRDAERLARRIALMIQRIAQGEDAGTFEVGFPTMQQLMINMRTAQDIGFSPRWQDLTDAEQLYVEPREQQPALTLLDAMRAALNANPELAASQARLDSSAEDIRIARSNLLPAVDASATRTQIDSDRASPLLQAEHTTSAGLYFQQIVYSERAWSGYSISRSLHEAAKHGQRQDVLDTLEIAASAYLDLLRAKSVEAVRRSNVENTRRNLETSRVRETVGLAGRSDYLRWQAQLARDKQDLLTAESARRQAETQLARIMHRPSTQPFGTVEAGLDDPLELVANLRTRAFLDTPANWSVFSEYVVHAALEHSPETAQADAVIASRQRAVTAARRAYFVPEIALVSSNSKTLHERGAGSTTVPGAPNDESWNVSLQVSLPIFTGRLRSAELSQARHELRASEADRVAATDAVEARARVALHRTASSHPSIDLSGQAAAAANENLAMVTDAYARGAVSVTDLIDAQDTALSAGLATADAKYTFLIDFVGVLRAMNEFEILLDPWSREAWIKRVEEWFSTHRPASPAASR
jgi:outer membrane protein